MMGLMVVPWSNMVLLLSKMLIWGKFSFKSKNLHFMHHRKYSNILFSILLYQFRYPLFLNLENHCSNKQQILVAKLLSDVFGGKTFPLKKTLVLSLRNLFSIDLHRQRSECMFSLAITRTVERTNYHPSITQS